ncbi:MAG: biotin--[acetyl-CoA-carboxylase] ligase [Solirubrobacteraceae bacterium]|nr:biotin--[acetyl-CoA-carboxylase] ligase [Solirubrobacteraceae bacterium]
MTTQSTTGPGWTRFHHERIGSTNDEARRLASEGAAHGTVVTADEQDAGRGRQGRSWVTPAGTALAASVVVRDLPDVSLLPLAVGVAVAETVGDAAMLKWPNDVVLVGRDRPDGAPDGAALRKIAGILCEGRPDQGWAIAGIGLNVAVDLAGLPDDVAGRAATMGLATTDRDDVLDELTRRLGETVALDAAALLDRWSARDVLRDRQVRWERPGGGDVETGRADGVADDGRLRVVGADGEIWRLDAGDVHLVA